MDKQLLLFEEEQHKNHIYDKRALDSFVENDIITPEEGGFMMGYLGA